MSMLLTWFVLRCLGKVGLLDIPDERSSHLSPTTTGGGLSFVVVVGISFLWNDIGPTTLSPWLIFSTGLAFLGFIDDYSPKPPAVRLLFQVSFCLVLWWWLLVESSYLSSLIANNLLGFLIFLFVTLSTVATINLFNFMDGSDGLASFQSVIFFTFNGFYALYAGDHLLFAICFILSGALLGFLTFNWPPAKLFMGDAGSYFIASQMVMLFFLIFVRGLDLAPGIILMSPFIVDSVLTLMKRFFIGETWWKPHRTHVYQIICKKDGSLRLLKYYFLLHFFFLIPLAFVALLFPQSSVFCLILSLSALSYIWYHYQKGKHIY